MAEASTAGQVFLREAEGSADTAVRREYDLFIGEGVVSYVFVGESSSNVSIAEARGIVRSADVNERRALAQGFKERLANAQDVAELWLVRESDPLTLAVIVRDLSLDRDLELRAMFADLTYKHDAELRVYAESDERAEFGRRGEQLLG